MTVKAGLQVVGLAIVLVSVLGGCITVQCPNNCCDGGGGLCGIPQPVIPNVTQATDGTICTNPAGKKCPNTNMVCGPSPMKCTTINDGSGLCSCGCMARP